MSATTVFVRRRPSPPQLLGGLHVLCGIAWLAGSRTSPSQASGISARQWRAFTRLLGTRHLGEGLLLLCAPTPTCVLAGARTDALHAASMMLLARASPAWRNTALASATLAACLSAYAIRCSRPRLQRQRAM